MSIDGFAIGLLFGLKRIRISLSVIFVIAMFSGFIIFVSMGFGRLLGEIVPTHYMGSIAGVMMICLGVYNLFNEIPLYQRSYFVMIALLINVDSFGYGIQAGLAMQSFSLAPLAAFSIGFSLLFGIIYGKKTKNHFFLQYITFMPSLFFILLGISKLFI